jgi:hypothetical protein
LIYRGDLNKNTIKSFYLKGMQEVTNKDYFGKSINYQIDIEKSIKNNTGVDMFIEKYQDKYLKYNCLSEPILKSFAIFDNISCKWNYKEDPKNRELFRPVSETIKTKSGDCDDHAICLASCMKSCGARSRIIHTDNHLFPELYVGKLKNKDKISTCIKTIYPSSKFKKLFYHEEKDELWLIMDYTEKYPGGKNLGTHTFETYELKD